MHLNQLAARLENIAPFHVMELAKMAAAIQVQGGQIINMGIGEPDFTAAPAVVEAATRAMRDGLTQYTPAMGLPALREAIAQHYLDVFGLTISPNRIVVTAGASAALLLACAALVEPGTNVLMPDPSYPCNRHFVAAFDGRAKLVASSAAERFQLSAASVAAHWDADTRGVLLATPSNPTGTSIAVDELDRIIQFVRAKGGYTIVDEIYQGLTYDAAPTTALALADDIVVINSFSKYFHMTGWRMGWMVIPENLVPAIEKLAQNLFICPSAIAQHASLACFLPESITLFEARKAEFKRRRDYIVPALEGLGFKVPVKPDGAFYVYADCSALTDDADQLTRAMLIDAHVVLVPGMDFGTLTAHDHVRLSYATSLENLHEAVRRLSQFVQMRRA